MSITSKYNDNITILKAFGIILMVIGHSGCNSFLHDYIYMFHMPLFFFVSGYCFKEHYLEHPKQFIINKLKGIYVPYVKWSLVFLLLHNVFFELYFYNSNYGWGNGTYKYDSSLFISFAKQIILKMTCHDLLLGGYWFLNALFFGSFFSWVIIKLFRRYTIVGVLVSCIMCLLLNEYGKPVTYFDFVPQTLLATTFLLIGYFFALHKIKVFNPIVSIACFLFVYAGCFLWYMEMGDIFYRSWKIMPYIISATLAVWSFYSILKKIQLRGRLLKFVSFFGHNTLTVLTWHLLSFKIVNFCIIFIYGLNIERLAEYPIILEYAQKGWWVIYTIVSITLTCGIAYCNKWIKYPILKL